ncbi:hypothetical protein ACN9MN_00545 [Chryseobacterium sp. S-02]|uniref:hypothetical protein n=1 Tax=Chryseobacterium sp. S-02 TaxID=3404064 RepID=UPI003CE85B60
MKALNNIGSSHTDEYKLSVFFEPVISRSFMIYNGINKQKVDITRFLDKTKVSVEPKKSVYSQEIQNVLRFEFSVATEELREFVAKTNVRVKLHFPFGEDTMEQLLGDFFRDINDNDL